MQRNGTYMVGAWLREDVQRLNFLPGSIQNGVQDGRRNMANWLISRNRSILGAINVLSTYGKQPMSYRKNILART